MRYFIAHLPKGPIEGYHRALVQYLAMRFGLKIRAGYLPAHITLKAPFEINDVTVVKNKLEKFVATECVQPFDIYKFGHFDKDVIFLDVAFFSQKLNGIVRRLQYALKEIPEISWEEPEPLKNFHITIAKKDIAEKFDEIWEYLEQKDPPLFELPFNNIALLRFESDKWVVDTVYELNP